MGNNRLARGSVAPNEAAREWLIGAVRARFPKLATALGEGFFETMLNEYLLREPPARRSVRESGARLADYLAREPQYPVWYSELARLDRAHVDVLHAPAVVPLQRCDLAMERELRLVPAHSLVELTTQADELWHAIDRGERFRRPRDLDWPRWVLVWRTSGLPADGAQYSKSTVQDRVLDPDEASALRAAVRGTSIVELAAGFESHARVMDLVVRWIDGGLILR